VTPIAIPYPPSDDPPVDLAGIVALDDFEPLARGRLHPAAYAYYAGGGWNGESIADNLAAWRRYRLLPRVLVDVATVDLRTTLLGTEVSMPVGIAPAAMHRFAHVDAESASARAAAEAGVLQVVSTVSSQRLEDIAEAAAEGPRWFQLYVAGDRGFARSLVERAEAAGYGAIVVTVDLPVLGRRLDLLRTGFDPGERSYGNFPVPDDYSGVFETLIDLRSVGLTWDDLATIRSWSRLPLVLKGILAPDDARLALEHGADAIWVSNHGGRQLDRVPATADALGPVVAAVDGRAEVYVDGGVRSGIDVLTALALGARAAFVARPILYAVACAGTPGVAHALELLRIELDRALALLGATSPAGVTREHVLLPR
jgi:isopentenyl diphosphate isomerase/L-lactate dehydrogenase-like FMN-dependent dehydrogenase